LFDLAFMEIDARPEHAAKLRSGSAGSKVKVLPQTNPFNAGPVWRSLAPLKVAAQ
jgi:hypothetical protein